MYFFNHEKVRFDLNKIQNAVILLKILDILENNYKNSNFFQRTNQKMRKHSFTMKFSTFMQTFRKKIKKKYINKTKKLFLSLT